MLRPGNRDVRGRERARRGISERFAQAHLSVAVLVSGAQHGRGEVVGEERRAQLIRLLRVLARRARGQDRDTLGRYRRLHHDRKHRAAPAALDAGQGARATRIEHEDPRACAGADDAIAERGEGKAGPVDVERFTVGVPRVVDEQQRLWIAVVEPRFDRIERGPQLGRARAGERHHVGVGEPADGPQDVGDSLGVLLGIAQLDVARIAAVDADDHRAACRSGRLRSRQEPEDRQRGGRSDHGVFSRTNAVSAQSSAIRSTLAG